jgi:membrane-associated phospholipid phosphatase
MILLVFGVVFLISIYAIINQWFPVRPRPETISRIPPLINHLPDNSFPSGHAMFAGALALYCFAFLKRWVAIVLFITGIIMVLSRIIV